MPRTVTATPSIIIQKTYGPTPNPIGESGGIYTKAPEPLGMRATFAVLLTYHGFLDQIFS